MPDERICGWLLGHRDKHNCGCQCKKPYGHKGYHRCELDLAADLPVQGEPEIRNVPQDDPFNPPPATTENQA